MIRRAGPADLAELMVLIREFHRIDRHPHDEDGVRRALRPLLDEIYVRDCGQGLGSAAMPEILHACRLAGAARMFLETEAHNTTVRRFYAKQGFTAEDSVWMSRDL